MPIAGLYPSSSLHPLHEPLIGGFLLGATYLFALEISVLRCIHIPSPTSLEEFSGIQIVQRGVLPSVEAEASFAQAVGAGAHSVLPILHGYELSTSPSSYLHIAHGSAVDPSTRFVTTNLRLKD